jgi:photosystem II stability/assembly factor-like uncharacterized protein
MIRHVLAIASLFVLAGCTSRSGSPVSPPVAGQTPALRGAPTAQARASGDAALKHDQPLQAARFRYEQRLSEDGTVPHGALLRAWRQREAMIALQALGGDVHPTGLSWTWLGPGNVGGRLRAIVIHPTEPNVMWIGSASGGIWKTTNGGASWFPLDDFLPSLAIGCMILDPREPDVLYAGTGEGFFETLEGTSNTATVRGAGIFKTTDGGQSWEQLPATDTPDWYFVNRLAMHPADSNILLAATGTGIYHSTDAGQSWTRVASGVIYDLQFHPTDGSRAVAGRRSATPLYTTDGGLTWQAASGASGLRSELRYARSNPEIVYAGVANNSRVLIYRSTDGGRTYVRRTSDSGFSTYAAYNTVIWVDPTNPDTLVMGGVYLYRSTDGGVTYSQQFSSVHPDHHIIVEHPAFDGSSNRTVFFGHDGGISRTTNVYGSSASALNNNLGVTQFYGAAINDATGVVIGGTQDNGTLRFGGDPQNWSMVIGGDGGFAAADPTDPNVFYGETQFLAIRRSTNGGLSFTSIYSGIGDSGGRNTNFIPYFVLDVNEPNRMLAAARRLWRSNNVKAPTPTWTAIKPSIEPGPGPQGDPEGAHFSENSPYNISTISVADGNSDLIWVGYNNGEVWKTENGTADSPTWVKLDGAGGSLPDRWISRIVIDPRSHERVYVAIMGWHDNNVWRTTDGGLSWTDVSGSGLTGIPSTPVSALAQHPRRAATLYAGTDIGLFVSHDDGQTWSANTEGPAAVPVEELIWRNDNTLMAVTHGRGVYLADASLPCEGDLNDDGLVNQSDLAILLADYGCTGGDCLGDVDGDGDTDLADLALLLASFGADCR